MEYTNQIYKKAILNILKKLWRSNDTDMWRKIYTVIKVYAEHKGVET